MGRWDLYLKTLVWENPVDFPSLLLAGARYLGRREGQFQTREIRSDGMIEAEYDQKLLIHVEFQIKKDKDIGERLLGYSYEAQRTYDLPVLSCVIYLKRVFDPPRPPHTWKVPGWGESMWFKYLSLELAETPIEELAQKELVGISPLLLRSKGGATWEVLDQAITRLASEHKAESLTMLRLIASIIFENQEALQHVLVAMSAASTERKARRYLLALEQKK